MKFGNDVSPPVSVFKAARLFSPRKVHVMRPLATDVDALSVFPFLDNPTIINSLKVELPSYAAKASDVSPDFDVLVEIIYFPLVPGFVLESGSHQEFHTCIYHKKYLSYFSVAENDYCSWRSHRHLGDPRLYRHASEVCYL